MYYEDTISSHFRGRYSKCRSAYTEDERKIFNAAAIRKKNQKNYDKKQSLKRKSENKEQPTILQGTLKNVDNFK